MYVYVGILGETVLGIVLAERTSFVDNPSSR